MPTYQPPAERTPLSDDEAECFRAIALGFVEPSADEPAYPVSPGKQATIKDAPGARLPWNLAGWTHFTMSAALLGVMSWSSWYSAWLQR